MFIYNLDASDYTELLSSVAIWTYLRKEKMHTKMIATTEYFYDKWILIFI